MKITAIIKSSTARCIALQTEPPLTQEVFQAIPSHSYGKLRFSFQPGILVVSSSSDIDLKPFDWIDKLLSEAEQLVQSQDKKAIHAHQDFLKTLARKTGLPIK